MDDSFRFAPGDRVTVCTGPPETHCRVPSYLRGKSGEVTEVVGRYRDPSLMAFHKPGLPMLSLYRIQFHHADIWGAASNPDTLMADIYEHWLTSSKES